MFTDNFICKESSVTRFIQVKTRLVQLDLLPFLTRSQLDNGICENWFKMEHFQQLLVLLKPHLEAYMDEDHKEKDESKKIDNGIKRQFVITGSLLRAACSFRLRPEGDMFLVNKAGSTGASYNPAQLLSNKLVCFVCPPSHSTLIQLSQIAKIEGNKETEDISKYFQPAATKEPSSSD